MKLAFLLLLTTTALAAADVAHLARSYLPPARFRTAERLVQAAPAAPAANYFAPATASFSSANFRSAQAAPARLVAPQQNFGGSAAFTAGQYNNAQYSQPSRQYLTPEVETFQPVVVQQSYSAPAISYGSPVTAVDSGAYRQSANIETKYSADGGYVY